MADLVFNLSVRALVQRVLQSGDIHFRFSGRSNAIEGVKGHQKLQKSRGEDYLAEQTVSDQISYEQFVIQVNGRADGCWPDATHFVVEEIKTIKVDVATLPEQVTRLHWGQLKVYAYLLGRDHGVSEATLRLTYYHIGLEQEFSFDDHWSMADLELEYLRIVELYANFLHRVVAWQAQRDASILDLTMPFGEFRPGQREMAVSVYRTLASNGQLVLQAPTGIGKTMGSLFPAVKAIRDLQFNRVFYLSAKTSGQQMARSAIAAMRDAGLVLRDVTITAKDKICFNPGSPCDPDFCQYARGYYDKLPGVIESQQSQAISFDRASVSELARQHEICPFELGLDLSDIADIVIADFNYVFDPQVYLRRHFDEPQKYALLMDESHNLVDRGREMFSADLVKEDVLALRRTLGKAAPQVKKALAALNKAMLDVARDVNDVSSMPVFPKALDRAMNRFVTAAEAWLEEQRPAEFYDDLLQLYFEVLRFVKVGDQADDDYAAIVEKESKQTRLRWYCVNPAKRLAEGFARLTSSICFSATLTPQDYYRSLLGLGEDSQWYHLPSPFDPNNLGVFVTSYLATTYHNRASSLYDLVDTIATLIAGQSGNYIVYFPSYAYLNMVYDKFVERHPGNKVIKQEPGMSDEERESFLETFDQDQTPVTGFAVMGGVFGEGVDLKGRRLIGVVVVGVGLPQIGIERDLIRDHFDQTGQGFEYAYQYPGMIRVLQTAGRVIRSEQDRGVVCLIDHRFNESRYRRLLPDHWQMTQVKSSGQLARELDTFWRKFEPA